MLALPTRSRNLMISSERRLIESGIPPDFNLFPVEAGNNQFGLFEFFVQ
jgi:hypothetical protein